MKQKPRIDQYAEVKAWPLLFETDTPTGKDFVGREDEVTVDLSGTDIDELHSMARRYSSTLAGLVLHILFDFFYGYYLLAKMRRQKYGLFTNFPAVDPSMGTESSLGEDRQLHLMVPRRLRLDLDRIAQREGVETHKLAGLIVHRYLDGHAPDFQKREK